jgi:hypothetical protein
MKKEKEKKDWKRKTISGRTTIHTLPIEEKDVKTNQMIRRNHDYNRWSQPHVCEAHVSNFFIFLDVKTKNTFMTKQY